MKNQFDPRNDIIQLCLKGISMEDSGRHEEATQIFEKACVEATDELEKFLCAYHMGVYHNETINRIKWLEKAIKYALSLDDVSLNSTLPTIYSIIASCYEELLNHEKSEEYYDLSQKSKVRKPDPGPFYHGTKVHLNTGDMLIAGGQSNYKDDLIMNHIYFTANINGAGLAAALAKGEGQERVYIVEPTGDFEDDPNVTDKKFPGNLTRSYRSVKPLKIIGEVKDWKKQTAEETNRWKEKLSNNDGEIIN